MTAKKVYACDAETDPFLNGRVPQPFMWGLYDGKKFERFDSTEAFVKRVKNMRCILYAHNGGKFDFMFLLKYIGETKAQIINGRIVSMFLGQAELRDSYAIIPEPLRKFGAKKDIEYWKLEKEYRDEFDAEIAEYLYWDCKVLYDAVVRYRSICGGLKTIASNALNFARKLGIDPGKTNHAFDSKYRPFFFGGHCECYQPGTRHDLILLDIHSAYPFAMMHDHATGASFVRHGDLNGMTEDQIARSFIKLYCKSKGAFPIRENHELTFPHEEREFYVTGWEYLTAKKFNLIENELIISVRHTEETINFKPYVDHWYAYKLQYSQKNEKGDLLDPMNYTIGKIMQNSLYGKLAQNPANYYDYKFVPACTEIDDQNGWSFYRAYEDHEIHRRESLWKLRNEYGVSWKSKSIYKNVATAASITGFTRAQLMSAMHTISMPHIIYCDTDGIVCSAKADLSRLRISEKVGDWGIEGYGETGHFAGKKLYGIKLKNGKTKIASKGSRLNQEDLERLVRGEKITWKNDSPSFRIDGTAKFVHREIRATSRGLARENANGT